MTNLPSFQTYGNYSTNNYGAHALQFVLPHITIWFSYTTPVAFNKNGHKVVSKNAWGSTTGKHLNWIDGGRKSARVPRDEFERQLEAALG